MSIEKGLRDWAADIRKNTKGQDVSASWVEAAADLDAAATEIERLRARLADCETSLNIFDEGRVSEYWMRHGDNQQ